MAQRMTVGDAYMAFRADTSDIDAAFERMQQSAQASTAAVKAEVATVGESFTGVAESASRAGAEVEQAGQAMQQAAGQGSQAGAQISTAWMKVAQSTAENQKAQNALRSALAAVRQTGGQSTAAIQALAIAHERATIAGREHAEALKIAEAEMKGIGVAETEATAGMAMFGVASKEAGEAAAFNMHEAKAEIALLGEETEVKIPRHLRSFVAELPGVGAALNAAFTATAIFMLVEILGEAAKKLSEFISDTFIYTEAQKEAYAAQVELNKVITEQTQKLEELKKAYSLIGLTGPDLTKAKFMEVTEQVEKEKNALYEAADTLRLYREGHDITAKEVDTAVGTISRATAAIRTLEQEQANLGKEYDQQMAEKAKEQLAQSIELGTAKLNADKRVGEAELELEAANARLLLTMGVYTASEQAAIQRDLDQRKYDSQVELLQNTIALLEKDPTRNASRIREMNAELLALQKEHEAQSLDSYAKMLQMQRDLRKQALESVETTPVGGLIPLTPAQQQIQALEDLMKQFGLQGSVIWGQQADAAQQAYDRMKANGAATYTDLLQMEEKLRAAQLSAAVSVGDSDGAAQYRKRLEDVRQELVKLGVTTDTATKKNENLRKEFSTLVRDLQHGSLTIRGALTIVGQSFAQGIGAAVAAAETGSEGFGAAMTKMAQSFLSSISAQATVAALFEIADAFHALANPIWAATHGSAAGHFIAAAKYGAVAVAAGVAAAALGGSSGGDSSGSETPQTSAAEGITQGQTAPVAATPQGPNVPRLALGGLVSAPTLAVIGDAMGPLSGNGGQREAVMPLDNPEALQQIGSALRPYVGGGGTQNHFHIDGLISPDNLTKVVKRINRAVKNNDVQLTASVAYRTTRKA